MRSPSSISSDYVSGNRIKLEIMTSRIEVYHRAWLMGWAWDRVHSLGKKCGKKEVNIGSKPSSQIYQVRGITSSPFSHLFREKATASLLDTCRAVHFSTEDQGVSREHWLWSHGGADSCLSLTSYPGKRIMFPHSGSENSIICEAVEALNKIISKSKFRFSAVCHRCSVI